MTKRIKPVYAWALVHEDGEAYATEAMADNRQELADEKMTHDLYWKNWKIHKVRISVVRGKKK